MWKRLREEYTFVATYVDETRIQLQDGPMFGYFYLEMNSDVHSFAFVSTGTHVRVLQSDYNRYSLCDWLDTEETFMRANVNKPGLEYFYNKKDLTWDDLPGLQPLARAYKLFGGGKWVDMKTFTDAVATNNFSDIIGRPNATPTRNSVCIFSIESTSTSIKVPQNPRMTHFLALHDLNLHEET
tara:strand:+ start:587 stop:1135 length:549 start_codon:yes stop_codon:yes gene_type:complete